MDLSSKLLLALESGASVKTLELSKRVGCITKKDVNKELYELGRRGLIEKTADTPPAWRLKSGVAADAGLVSSSEAAAENGSTESRLNELAQSRNWPAPQYEEEEGGNNQFRCRVKFLGLYNEWASGSSKKQAKASAAEITLNAMKSDRFRLVPEQGIEGASLIEQLSICAYHNQLTNSQVELLNGRQIIAAFLLKDKRDDTFLDVLSVASGSSCIGGNGLSREGDVVNDCHAEILARRGLLKHIYSEMKEDSTILERRSEDGLYSLRPDLSLHLYISQPPCGDCSNFKDPSDQNAGSHEPIYSSEKQCLLRCKSEKGEGTIPRREAFEMTFDGLERGERLHTMSCSDKILRWNALGLQGALLSFFVAPIAIASITVGNTPGSEPLNTGHFCRALCCRTKKHNTHHPVMMSVPAIASTSASASVRHVDTKKRTADVAVVWAKGDKSVELLDPTTGMLSVRRGAEPSTQSAVSKSSLFSRWKETARLARRPDMANLSYLEAKRAAVQFQEAKQQFLLAIKRDCGDWVSKPIELDDFA